MDTGKRLLRRPVTAVLWTVLMAVTALILSSGCVLWYASSKIYTDFDENNLTIAMRNDLTVTDTGDGRKIDYRPFTQETLDALTAMDSVEDVCFHTLTGAYSPSFSPILGLTGQGVYTRDLYTDINEAYSEIALKVTVKSILHETAQPLEGGDSSREYADAMARLGVEPKSGIGASDVDLWVVVDEVIDANPDFGIEPGDEIAWVGVRLLGRAAEDFFEAGDQLLVTGMYQPHGSWNAKWGIPGSDPMSAPEIPRLPWLYSPFGYVVEEDGALMSHYMRYGHSLDLVTMETSVIFSDDMTMPCAFPPDMSGDKRWTDYLELLHIQNGSLPVLGTPRLESVYQFFSENASIVEGRSFTKDEYDSGAGVCVISETEALRAGISVGDTLELRQFPVWDSNSAYSCNASVDVYGRGVEGKFNNPTVGAIDGFLRSQRSISAPESFTVVGLYRVIGEWSDDSWAFTPNTVFIPQKAQIPGGFGGPDFDLETQAPGGSVWEDTVINGSFGVYMTVILKNGCRDMFTREVEGTALQGEFTLFDQDYDALIGVMRGVITSAKRLVIMTLGGFLALFSLYVLICQGAQRRNLGIMRSLGSGKQAARRYLFSSGLVPVWAGLVIGCFFTARMAGRLDQYLFDRMDGLLPPEKFMELAAASRPGPGTLAALLAAELAFTAAALWLHALYTAGRRPRRLLGV